MKAAPAHMQDYYLISGPLACTDREPQLVAISKKLRSTMSKVPDALDLYQMLIKLLKVKSQTHQDVLKKLSRDPNVSQPYTPYTPPPS